MDGWQTSLDLREVGEGIFECNVSDDWNAGSHPDGGYVMAAAVRAMREMVLFPDPISSSCFFLRPVLAGAATIEVDVVRTGRTVATAEARLLQDGKERNRTVATFAELSPHDSADVDSKQLLSPPVLPDPEQCVAALRAPTPSFVLPITDRVEMRYAPGSSVSVGAEPSDRWEISSWLRFADSSDPDPFAMPVAVDAYLPVPLESDPLDWSPTLELTVLVRARPVPGWLRIRRTTTVIASGYFEESGEVWDAADRLVAQSRQLARLGAPRR